MRGDPIVDGRLTMAEVLREWELNADLVTLSACETALGQRIRGEGFLGLAHAFFRAGARSVVVSLWQVDDRVTSALMRQFYAELAKGTPKSDALRAAKLWLRDELSASDSKNTAAPFYWAPFVLIGLPD
jgi:CHAT domain-containing protein